MSALTRFERLDDLFPDMFRRFMRPAQLSGDLPAEIRVDVSENDNAYQVSAEVPGAKKDDIRVVVDGNYVSITAEVRKDHVEREGGKRNGRVLVKETFRGTMSRGFTLAHEIDDKATVARLEDGVLHLTLPKRSGAGSKLIAVQ